MNAKSDIAQLLSWDATDTIPDGHYVRLHAHPDFARAARQLSRNMLAAAQSDRALDGIAKDGGRFVATTWALYLDATGGLTLPRLKEMCAASKLLSPGRARAVLLFLRYLGYVEMAPQREPNGPVRYWPTRGLIATWEHMMRSRLEASRIIEPALGVVLARLHERKILDAIFRQQGQAIFEVASVTDQDNPVIAIFLHRHAGMQMLHAIIATADEDDDFPPRKAVPITIAAIARRLNVSRTHVKRMLSAAERAGLLSGADTGLIVLSEKMREWLLYLFSTLLLGNIIVSAKVAQECADVLLAPALQAEAAE